LTSTRRAEWYNRGDLTRRVTVGIRAGAKNLGLGNTDRFAAASPHY
jgi:hypothetical protein